MHIRPTRHTRTSRSDRLDPVRWSPRRRARLVRAGLVAALLLLAAGVLLAGTGPAVAARCDPGPARTGDGHPPTAAPTRHPAVVPSNRVGVPVRLSQPSVTELVQPGDRVDLAVTSDGASQATIVVRNALVLRTTGDSSGNVPGSMVYLALTEQQARTVVAIAPDARVGVTVRPG